MKNACVISDGGKILPKCSSNTFYHVNNNANNRQQQHQQSYIKHAPLRNSPPSNKSKYSIHGNISDRNSNEDNSRTKSNVQYYNSTNKPYEPKCEQSFITVSFSISKHQFRDVR